MDSERSRRFLEGTINRNVIVLSLTSMVSTFFLSLWQGYIPLYLRGVGLSVSSIGLLLTLGAITVALASFVAGSLGDYLGRKFMIVVSTITLAFAPIALSFSFIYYIVLGLLLFYWSTSALQPNFRALITESVDKAYRGRALGFLNSMSVALTAVSFIVSGLILHAAEPASYVGRMSTILLLSGIVIMLVALFRGLFIRETKKGSKTPLSTIAMRNVMPLRDRFLKLLTIAYIIHDAGLSLVMFMVPLYAQYIGMNSLLIGIMFALNSIVMLITQIPFGRLADKSGRTRVIVISFVLEALAIGSMVLVQNPVFLISVYGIWVAVGQMDMPALGALLADLSRQEDRATIMGGFSGLTTIASIPAPFVGGLIFSFYPSILGGYLIPFVLSFIMLAAGAIIAIFYRVKVYSK
ncbi:MAG: MFS transporter [Conexivisphaerales archaeon]